MAEKITFNTGAKSYEIVDQDGNDLGVFRFVPTDVGILNRYKETAAFFASVGDINEQTPGCCPTQLASVESNN